MENNADGGTVTCMDRHADQLRALLFVVLSFAPAVRSRAQTTYIHPDEEAPTALFQTEIGSSDVDLVFGGSWEASLIGSIGFAVNPGTGEPVARAQFPGMTPGVVFTQTPDLTVSLRVNEQYFFETSVGPGYEIESFLLGYTATENVLLREVRIGNTEIGMEQYGMVRIPETPPQSIGSSALFATPGTRHELALRFDPVSSRHQVFVGNNEIVETEIDPGRFVSEKTYILPDGGLDFVDVYVEVTLDPAETEIADVVDDQGRTYRRVRNGQAEISRTEGRVTFTPPIDQRVIVYYEKAGTPVGAPGLGKDALAGTNGSYISDDAVFVDFELGSSEYLGRPMDSWRVASGSTEYLLIADPGRFSPFEHCGIYEVETSLPDDRWRTTVHVAGEKVTALVSPGQSLVTLTVDPGNPRNPLNRYPLAGRYPDLYGPLRDPKARAAAGSVIVRTTTPVERIQLESPVPGSVRVVRNNRPENRFTVSETGVLMLATPLGANERLDVYYEERTSAAVGGNLVFGFGNRFTLYPGLTAAIATGVAWNVLAGTYSTRPNQYQGSVLAAGNASYEGERLSASADVGVSVYSPDTSGVFRLAGMEADGTVVPVIDTVVRPATPPYASPAAVTVSKENRGRLVYKDYRTYTAAGAVLNAYDWTGIPEENVYSYENGAPSGPYLVSSAGEISSAAAMALDYALAADETWVGAQLAVDPGTSPPDFSYAETLVFSWRGDPEPNDLRLFVQVGRLGEDLDVDGRLDAETSEYDNGFTFNDVDQDPEQTVVLRIGGGLRAAGNGSIETEDTDGNGVLGGENAGSVMTREIAAGSAAYPTSDKWRRVEISLTDDDRRKLHAVSGVRFLLVNENATAKEGRLLIGAVSFQGSTFTEPAGADPPVLVRELPDTELTAEFPEVAREFHSAGEEQRVLDIQWSGADPSSGITVSGRIPRAFLSQYRTLSFYAAVRGLTPTQSGRITLELLEAGVPAVSVTVDAPEQQDWRKYAVDLKTGAVTVNGSPLTADVHIDSSVPHADTLRVSVMGVSAGELAVDEVHLRDPRLELGAGGTVAFEYAEPGPVFAPAGVPVLGSVSFGMDVTARSSGFSPQTDYADAGLVATNVDLSADLALVSTEVRAGVRHTGEAVLWSGGHTLSFPSVSFPVRITERFDARNMLAAPLTSRSLSLELTAQQVGAVALSVASSNDQSDVIQEWKATAESTWPGPFSLSLNADAAQLTPNQAIPGGGYFDLWINGFSLASPLASTLNTERRVRADVRAAIRLPQLQLSVPSDLNVNRRYEYGVVHTTSGSLAPELSATLFSDSPRPLTFTLSYDKRFSVDRAVASDTFTTDISRGGEALYANTYIYTIPFYELGEAQLGDRFGARTESYQAASYVAGSEMTVERRTGSYVPDLFLPGTFTVGVQRSLSRNADSLLDEREWSAAVTASAINLFGSRGVHPFTPLYESDEFISALSGFLTEDLRSGTHQFGFVLQHVALFYGDAPHRLEARNRFEISQEEELTWAEELTATLAWGRALTETITIPLLNLPPDTTLSIHHTDSLSVEYQAAQKSVAASAKHASTLMMGSIGSVEAHVKLGVTVTRKPNEAPLVLIGAEGGLSARIAF